MSRLIAIFVAACALMVASANAADVQMYFFSQVEGENMTVARDVHYAVKTLDGDAVAEDSAVQKEGVSASFSADPAVYLVVAEQPSNHFFGSVNVPVEEGQDPVLLLLDAEGLHILEGYHVCDEGCKCLENDGDGCKCDADCICWKIHPVEQPAAVTPAQAPSTPAASAPAAAPQPIMPWEGVPGEMGGSMGGIGNALGIAGLVAGIVALATQDDHRHDWRPIPVSHMMR